MLGFAPLASIPIADDELADFLSVGSHPDLGAYAETECTLSTRNSLHAATAYSEGTTEFGANGLTKLIVLESGHAGADAVSELSTAYLINYTSGTRELYAQGFAETPGMPSIYLFNGSGIAQAYASTEQAEVFVNRQITEGVALADAVVPPAVNERKKVFYGAPDGITLGAGPWAETEAVPGQVTSLWMPPFLGRAQGFGEAEGSSSKESILLDGAAEAGSEAFTSNHAYTFAAASTANAQAEADITEGISIATTATTLADAVVPAAANTKNIIPEGLANGDALTVLTEEEFQQYHALSTIARNDWVDQNENTADIHTSIDEVVPDDADWIRSPFVVDGAPTQYDFKIQRAFTPSSPGPHKFSLIFKKDGTGATTMRVDLYSGISPNTPVLFASRTFQVNETGFTRRDYQLDEDEISAITNYDELWARFYVEAG